MPRAAELPLPAEPPAVSARQECTGVDFARESGRATMEAIRAATLNAAALIGWQARVGVVEADRYADLIAVHGDPLAGITMLIRVEFASIGSRYQLSS